MTKPDIDLNDEALTYEEAAKIAHVRPTPAPIRETRGWDCGCPQDGKHTACPLHAKSDVYIIPAPIRETGTTVGVIGNRDPHATVKALVAAPVTSGTPMSALDQQVAEARGVLSKAAYRRSNENVPVDHRTREADYERALDALLTTHRRQVFAEVRTRLVATDPVGLKTGPLFDWLTKEMGE